MKRLIVLLSLIALPLAAARPRSRIRSPKSGSTPVGQRTLSGKTFPSMEDHSPNGRLDLSAFDGCPVYRDFLTPEELSVIDFSSCAVFDFTNVKFVEHGSVNLDCLFPTVPTYKQVDQGRIGDCYLVSSIKSSLVYVSLVEWMRYREFRSIVHRVRGFLGVWRICRECSDIPLDRSVVLTSLFLRRRDGVRGSSKSR